MYLSWNPNLANFNVAAATAKLLQSCPILCDPIDGIKIRTTDERELCKISNY